MRGSFPSTACMSAPVSIAVLMLMLWVADEKAHCCHYDCLAVCGHHGRALSIAGNQEVRTWCSDCEFCPPHCSLTDRTCVAQAPMQITFGCLFLLAAVPLCINRSKWQYHHFKISCMGLGFCLLFMIQGMHAFTRSRWC